MESTLVGYLINTSQSLIVWHHGLKYPRWRSRGLYCMHQSPTDRHKIASARLFRAPCVSAPASFATRMFNKWSFWV